MRLYISGPMTGIPNNNREAFLECEKRLIDDGFNPENIVNPAKLDEDDVRKSWEDYLRRDLKILLDCQAIILLDGWHRSHGALLEFQLASRLDMKWFFYDNYLAGMYKDHPIFGGNNDSMLAS